MKELEFVIVFIKTEKTINPILGFSEGLLDNRV